MAQIPISEKELKNCSLRPAQGSVQPNIVLTTEASRDFPGKDIVFLSDISLKG